MENVVYLSELDQHISDAITKVNDGIKLARAAGVMAEYPKAIDFDLIVVARWQDLAIETGESGVSSETGGSTEASTTNSSGSTTGTDTRNTINSYDHAQQSKSTLDNYSI